MYILCAGSNLSSLHHLRRVQPRAYVLGVQPRAYVRIRLRRCSHPLLLSALDLSLRSSIRSSSQQLRAHAASSSTSSPQLGQGSRRKEVVGDRGDQLGREPLLFLRVPSLPALADPRLELGPDAGVVRRVSLENHQLPAVVCIGSEFVHAMLLRCKRRRL